MPKRWNKKPRRSPGSGGGGGNRKRHHNNNNNNTPSIATSIEEDLRQQRMRQQQRREKQEEQEQAEEESKKAQQEEQQVDEHVVEFNPHPHHQQQRPQHLLLHRNGVLPFVDTNDLGSSSFPSSLSLGYILEQSPILNSRHREKLRQIWHSKYLLEEMYINNKASLLYDNKIRWIDHSLPDGMICPWDLASKHYLHPSSRTIDVGYVNSSSSNHHDDVLPTIATTVQGGWALMKDQQQQHVEGVDPIHPRRRGGGGDGGGSICTMRSKAVHAIRIHEKSGRYGTVVRRETSSNTPYRFQWYTLPNLSWHTEANLYYPVNDFCFGDELAIFACPRYYGGNTIPPIFLSLEDHNLREINVQNFPPSDALRIEMACDNNEKYVAFGHRNGQVSLLDLRQSSTICTIFQHLPNNNNNNNGNNGGVGGSATDLGFLNSTRQLLVKRSFGTCQLHDLRRLTSTARKFTSSSSLIYNLCPPNDGSSVGGVHETLSAHCNGFAIDPVGEQTMVSSYINMSQEACLAIWSLGTGVCVGSKVIASSNNTAGNNDVIYTEICQRTTPAYNMTSSTKKKRKIWKDDGSFGIWMKCGRFSHSKSQVNAKFGSLNHITLPGYWQYKA